jgi:hypothetical protein
VHTGDVSCNFAKSFFTATTRAPVDIDPMFNIKISCLVSLETFPCLSVPLVLTPRSLRSKKKFTCKITVTQGSALEECLTTRAREGSREGEGKEKRGSGVDTATKFNKVKETSKIFQISPLPQAQRKLQGVIQLPQELDPPTYQHELK